MEGESDVSRLCAPLSLTLLRQAGCAGSRNVRESASSTMASRKGRRWLELPSISDIVHFAHPVTYLLISSFCLSGASCIPAMPPLPSSCAPRRFQMIFSSLSAELHRRLFTSKRFGVSKHCQDSTTGAWLTNNVSVIRPGPI